MKYTLVIWLSDYSVTCQAASLRSLLPPLYLLHILQVGPLELCHLPFFIIHTYVQSFTQSFIHVCMGSWFLCYSMDNNLSPSLLILMLKLPHIWWVGKFSSWILDPSNMSLSFCEHFLAFRHKTVQTYFIFVSSVPILKSCHFSREPRFLPMQNGSFFIPRAREYIIYIEIPVNTWIYLCLYLLFPHLYILKVHSSIFHSNLT